MSRRPKSGAPTPEPLGAGGLDLGLPGGPWMQGIAATLTVYLLVVLFYRDLVFLGMTFAGSGDTSAALAFERWGRAMLERGVMPLWNPLIFSGMPSFGSLQFTPDVYPVLWLKPVYGLLLFGGTAQNLLIHHILGGVFAYLLLRDLRLEAPIALFGAVVFFFSPQEVALAALAHGGKLFTIAWLPLVLLLLRRLLDRPGLVHTALLALVTGLQLMALHMQIAYYGMLMMGLWFLIDAWQRRGERDMRAHLSRAGLLGAAVLLAIALSAHLLWPVYEYSQQSIRGGGAIGGGVSYDYATSWSFHPVETLTLILPGWLGFGGQTYWGYMPFTDHPYYMGLLPLALAVIALVLARRDRTVQALGLLGGLALLVAFGRHLPILYGPLYRLLPFFAKFRIPAMIMVLVLLAVACLAPVGLRRLLRLEGERAERWARGLLRAALALAVVVVVLLLARSAFEQIYAASATSRYSARYGVRPAATMTLAREAYGLFRADALRVGLLTAVSLAALALALRGRLARWVAVAVVLVATTADLWVTNARLVETKPRSERADLQDPGPAARFLQEQEGTFRIVDLGRQQIDNRYMFVLVEDAEGYSPVKLRAYQELLDRLPQGRIATPEALAMLNVAYVVTAGEVTLPGFTEVFAADGTWIYAFAGALGPAWLVGDVVRVGNETQMLDAVTGGVDPATQAVVLDDIGAVDPVAARQGSVAVLERGLHRLHYRVEAPGPVLLVLSEVWYPAGWRAEVEGEAAPIHRTDHVLRGVRVDPTASGGSAEVVLTFAPASVVWGRRLSLATLLVLVLMIGGGLVTGTGRTRTVRDGTTVPAGGPDAAGETDA